MDVRVESLPENEAGKINRVYVMKVGLPWIQLMTDTDTDQVQKEATETLPRHITHEEQLNWQTCFRSIPADILLGCSSILPVSVLSFRDANGTTTVQAAIQDLIIRKCGPRRPNSSFYPGFFASCVCVFCECFQ